MFNELKTHNARSVFPLLTWILKRWIIRTMDVGKHAWKRTKKSFCTRQRTRSSLVNRLHCPWVTSLAGGVATLSLISNPHIRSCWVKKNSFMWWRCSDKALNDNQIILGWRDGLWIDSFTKLQNIPAFENQRFIPDFSKVRHEVITTRTNREAVYCVVSLFPSSFLFLYFRFVINNFVLINLQIVTDVKIHQECMIFSHRKNYCKRMIVLIVRRSQQAKFAPKRNLEIWETTLSLEGPETYTILPKIYCPCLDRWLRHAHTFTWKKNRRLTDGVNFRRPPHVHTSPMRFLPVTFQRTIFNGELWC